MLAVRRQRLSIMRREGEREHSGAGVEGDGESVGSDSETVGGRGNCWIQRACVVASRTRDPEPTARRPSCSAAHCHKTAGGMGRLCRDRCRGRWDPMAKRAMTTMGGRDTEPGRPAVPSTRVAVSRAREARQITL